MGTAVTCINTSAPIEFFWRAPDQSYKFYSYMHFGEVEKLQPNQTREFVIKLNGLKTSSAIVPNYLYSTVMYDLKALTGDWFNYSIEQTANSTLPPIMNAIEFFFVKDFLQSETDEADVSAVKKIQTAYRVVKDWVANPCAPQNHAWNGIDCTFSNFDPPRIISLVFPNKRKYMGRKHSYFYFKCNFKIFRDLSNNNLTGSVPDFLSQMASLTVLKLNGNNLSGTVPSTLTEKSQQGSLPLSVEGNPNLCSSGSCTLLTTTSKKTSALIPIIVSVVVVVVLLVIITITDYSEHRAYTRNPSLGLKGRNTRFSFSDVLIMTNNFQKILGEGGFGKVYYGILEDNSEVAVKVLNPSLSSEGYKQFHTEAEILMMVHHTNLASMIGYCQEGKHLCVVYELMANGNLEDYLSPVKNPKFPSWEERLNIALDAAQGLEYLHHGCKPAIIHRDVKTTNILLDKALQAKFADFGISKIFPDDKCTHVSTGIKGTPGYLDPELFNCLNLNEKSDVYGFGVVLCEIIAGQRAILDVGDGFKDNITNWVSNIIAVKGDVRATVDQRLQENYDVNSTWKLVETSIACISNPSSKRPTMNQMEINLAGRENMSTPLNPGAKKTGSSPFSLMGTPRSMWMSTPRAIFGRSKASQIVLQKPRKTTPVICLSLIVFAIATLIIFLVVKPRTPQFDIPNASLSTVYFDTPEYFNGNFNFVANFTNPNKKIDVQFERAEVDLYFFNKLIATTSLPPFHQRRGENLAVKLQSQVQRNRIMYNIRVRFKVRAHFGSVHYSYWLHGRCELEMTGPPYGVLIARTCKTTK
ncbi:hypothetical protein QQ045_017327 [Rhodiola kirilowii]